MSPISRAAPRLAALSLVAALAIVTTQTDELDPALLAGLKARSIGPAAMSGRIAAIDAVRADPNVVWVGAATGGVWKSTDGALTWEPVFDDQPVAAIGAVAIDQSNPDVVWVGTGEGNPRNSASVGNGVYKTLDGGRTWTHLGLEKTEKIHRILLDPRHSDVAYVAALGTTWGENEQRGVFKTVDGGRTWEKILYVDERTGAADLAMAPGNPNKLVAAMWDHRRWPWFFRSGGPGSGLYLSHDGGGTWKRLTEDDGLPKGELGRMGVAFAPSDPRVVYAFVEAEKNAIMRSSDGGATWKTVSEAGRRIGNRPFYYADLRVDPENPDRVYSLWSVVSVSNDGGKTFEVILPFSKAHPDHHAMWIDPSDARHIIDGNDGGVAISHDRGESWRFVRNLPVGQFYHVRVDDELPYNIYGGMQDNGSWRGPSQVWTRGGIQSHHWQEVDFGDGFDTVPHPDDSTTGWSMSQEGYLRRWNLETGERKDIRPIGPEGTELRFNWNAGLAVDPFDSDTIYYGSQFVHRSRDRGDSWEIVSPDLTTNNPDWQKQAESGGLTPDVTGAENFTSILSIAPSGLERGVVWVGTDDGRVHVTRDGGATWTSLENNVRGVPENTWVPHIEPSRFDAGTAYVVFDDHRRANWTPYVYEVTEYGRRWKSIATDEISGYALSIVQDSVHPDLLFLGTEFGLFVTRDRGRRWFKWTHGVPTVSVMDIALQERERDLVLGTHGRSIFILDDIAALGELTGAVREKPLHLFSIPDAIRHAVGRPASSRFPGQGEFRGENRPYGALITYWLAMEGLPHPDEEIERRRKQRRGEENPEEAPGEEQTGDEKKKGPQVEIRITDAEGKLVRKLERPATLGLNRAVWDLRRERFEDPPREEEPSFFDRGGPRVLPGSYGVTIKMREHEARAEVIVLPDPRSAATAAEQAAKHRMVMRAGELNDALVGAIRRVQEGRRDVEAVLARLKKPDDDDESGGGGEKGDENEAIRKAARELDKSLDEAERTLWQPPDTKGIIAETDGLSKIGTLRFLIGGTAEAPTPAQRTRLERAEALVAELLAGVNELFAEKVAPFREKVREMRIELFPEQEPLALE